MKFEASFTVQLGARSHTTTTKAELPDNATPKQIDATIKAVVAEAARKQEEKSDVG